jgi:hypothetical protein
MPATKREQQLPPGLEPALSTMYCPQCGHTSNYHGSDSMPGCTQCGCGSSWIDILIVHVNLYHA